MAYNQIGSYARYPDLYSSDVTSTTFSQNTVLLNLTNEVMMAVCQAPKDITIRKIGFNIASTSSYVGTIEARVETLDGSGNPSGALWGTTTNALFTPAAGWTWVTLTSDATVSMGEYFAFGARCTLRTSGSVTGHYSTSNWAYETHMGLPYVAHSTSSKQGDCPNLAIELSDGTKCPIRGILPHTSIDVESFKSNSTPPVRGARFKLAFPARIAGVLICGNWTQNSTIYLYDYNLSARESFTFTAAKSAGSGMRVYYIPFGNTLFTGATQKGELQANQYYRIAITPSTTTAATHFVTMDCGTSAVLDCHTGGSDFHYTTCSSDAGWATSGNWTDTTSKRPIGFSLLFSGLEDGYQIAAQFS